MNPGPTSTEAPKRSFLSRLFHWLFSWRTLRRALIALAGLITLLALAYTVENIRGKRAWNLYQREWEAKGEKLHLSELAPKPVPDDQNLAMTPLLLPLFDYQHTTNGLVRNNSNAFARLDAISAAAGSDTRTNKLFLGSVESGRFADLGGYRDFYRGNTNYPQPASPGRPAQDILVALSKYDSELKELAEAAAQRPHCRFPIEYDYPAVFDILLPHLAILRNLSSLAQLRAIARIDLGQTDAALADLKLNLRLSQTIAEEPVLISHLVRLGTLTQNLQTIREGLVRHAWSDTQLAEIDQALAAINVLAEYKFAMRGERAFVVDGLEYMRQHPWNPGFEAPGDGPDLKFGPMPSGWYYQNMITLCEMHRQSTLPLVDERARRCFPPAGEFTTSPAWNQKTWPYRIFAGLLFPAVDKVSGKSVRMQTWVDQARLACALERYRLVQGSLPTTLDALKPAFVTDLPADIMTGTPLKYRPNSDGGYVLYSVGWNQKDDGGVASSAKKNTSYIDFSQGDWVWTMPAKR